MEFPGLHSYYLPDILKLESSYAVLAPAAACLPDAFFTERTIGKIHGKLKENVPREAAYDLKVDGPAFRACRDLLLSRS